MRYFFHAPIVDDRFGFRYFETDIRKTDTSKMSVFALVYITISTNNKNTYFPFLN